ncbi:MAG: 1,4-dihydroxy-2-naphthoate octaprenyltransferase [Rickettsiales bacterium]|nr:1,4-dihydroxy-2-naphthoate octaprenyltransferase [Rickettsiales bacterium]|tara:strand:+ start:525 stop:1379 length:855 start_codon:yes stop_codon:yes gene_type:complete
MAVKYWLLATRPKTLTAALCPVLLGLSIATELGPIDVTFSVITLLCAILIQIGTNFANDYFDFKKGGDSPGRIGPQRMVQAGHITETQMKRATIITLSCAFLFGLLLVYKAGWPILIIGIISIICAVLYTGSPFSLAYTGTADLFVLAFFGPIAVMGTVFIQSTTWSLDAFYLGLGLGAIATALLVVNNVRDYTEDKKNNKKTIVVRLGQLFGKLEYSLCIMVSYAVVFTQSLNQQDLALIIILGALSAYMISQIWIKKEKELNTLLAQIGLFLISYTICLILI